MIIKIVLYFTVQIECVELGQIYYSPLELYSSQMTPPRQRRAKPNRRERMILTGLHAEVWVATKEEAVSCIEVIDVLARVCKKKIRLTCNINYWRALVIAMYELM